MSIASPILLSLGLLALPVIAAYLHRRKRKTQRVSSALLFRVIAGENTPTRRALATPRHLVSLGLILAALIAMVVGAADLRPQTYQPHDTVIVLDTSASMGAQVSGSNRSRLDEARDALRDAVGSMGPGDRLALVTSGAQTSVQIGLTEDHEAVLALADEAQPEGSSANLEQALTIADAMAAGSDGTKAGVVLLTDGVGVSVPAALDRTPQIVTVGSTGPNLGINALSVREADALGLAEVYLSISSNISTDRDVEVVLAVDETIVDVLPIAVPSRSAVETLHRVELPAGARVVAKLQNHGDDVLSVDDVASAPRAQGQRVRVVLVTRSRVSFTAEALRLHPRVDLRILGPFDSAPAEPADLLILEADYRAGELPASRAVLAMGVDPTPFGLQVDQRVPAPEIMRWSFDDPLFRFVDLDAIDLPRAETLRLQEGVRSLLDSERGALAVEAKLGERDLVFFGFAPHDSDLVLRVGFVNFIANAVEWAAPAAPDDPSARPAEVLPATETLLDPVSAIPGTTRGDFGEREPTKRPLWRWLAWIALGLMVVEGLLPWGSLALHRWRRRASEEGDA